MELSYESADARVRAIGGTSPEGKPGRYKPNDRLLAFLKGL